MYQLVVGDIPENHQVDHLCRVRDCINPDHLEPVTQQENIARGELSAYMRAKNAAREYCKAGIHPWVPENIRSNGSGQICLPCRNKYKRDQYEKRKDLSGVAS
ncbi:HNH endonuclease signature motif containing protein [Mycolicibacterium wolinskyi]